jgi:hypothetical protein
MADPLSRRNAIGVLAGTSLVGPASAQGDNALPSANTRGADLIGFRMPITAALERQAQGKLAERVSWLDFLPFGKHAAILARTGNDDLTEYLQRMLDNLPPGSRLYVPGRVNFEGPLRCDRSITLFGDPGRENFDNSWDNGNPGSQLIYRGNDSDALTFAAPRRGYSRVNVVLRDFILRGNRCLDNGGINGSARRGRGLVIAGTDMHDSAMRIDMDNVHVAQAMDQGIDLEGSVYGGSIRNCFINRCGKTGFRAVTGRIPIGEMWLARMRIFQNGWNGRTDEERAGFCWRAGTLHVSQMSSSENKGPGVMLGGGPFAVGTLQMESNGQAVASADRRQLVIGLPDAGVLSCRITNLQSSPGEAFGGAHVFIASNASNVKLDGGFLGDTLGATGRHIERVGGGGGLDYSGLATAQGQLVIADRAGDFDTRHSVLLLARMQAAGRNVTGDGARVSWAPDTSIADTRRIYDPRTGAITAPASGAYRIDIVIGLENITAAHDEARLFFNCANAPRVEELGNPGALRSGSGRLSLKSSQIILLHQGETCQIAFSVGGGSRTIGVTGGGLHGTLSVSTAN